MTDGWVSSSPRTGHVGLRQSDCYEPLGAGAGQNCPMFERFVLQTLQVGPVRLRVRHGGSGPAVLLIHGHPRTHTTWWAVAPQLIAAGFTVVCPDLRGYGRSSTEPDEADHAQASKRRMAGDLVGLMGRLGHSRFTVVGHDRGGYVAQRLALDFPAAVQRLIVLGDVPIGEALARADARFATAWFHWFFLAQPAPLPERAIAADPDGWYRLDPAAMGPDNYADVAAAVADPAVRHAMCEDYRAGLGPDRAADDADRAAGRRIIAPTLVLWGSRDDLADLYDADVLGVWQPWADQLSGASLDAGHHLMEDSPDALAAAIVDFLRPAMGGPGVSGPARATG